MSSITRRLSPTPTAIGGAFIPPPSFLSSQTSHKSSITCAGFNGSSRLANIVLHPQTDIAELINERRPSHTRAALLIRRDEHVQPIPLEWVLEPLRQHRPSPANCHRRRTDQGTAAAIPPSRTAHQSRRARTANTVGVGVGTGTAQTTSSCTVGEKSNRATGCTAFQLSPTIIAPPSPAPHPSPRIASSPANSFILPLSMSI
jgi:hypothetical protein